MKNENIFDTDTKEWMEKQNEVMDKIIPLLDGLTLNQIKKVFANIETVITLSIPLTPACFGQCRQ
jgi:hypothetical protein